MKYNAEGLSDSVDENFHELAQARFRKHPWRTLFVLPLARLYHVFASEPDYEMPMKVRWLGIPFIRPLFGVIDLVLTFLAAAGASIAWRRSRSVFWLVVPAVLLRLGIYAFAIPHAASHRFLVEAFPLFLVLAGVAVAAAPTRRRLEETS
jgi:hypothetical protein